MGNIGSSTPKNNTWILYLKEANNKKLKTLDSTFANSNTIIIS